MLFSILYDEQGKVQNAVPTNQPAANDTINQGPHTSNSVQTFTKVPKTGKVEQINIEDPALVQELLHMQQAPTQNADAKQVLEQVAKLVGLTSLRQESEASASRFPVGSKPGSKIVIPKAA